MTFSVCRRGHEPRLNWGYIVCGCFVRGDIVAKIQYIIGKTSSIDSCHVNLMTLPYVMDGSCAVRTDLDNQTMSDNPGLFLKYWQNWLKVHGFPFKSPYTPLLLKHNSCHKTIRQNNLIDNLIIVDGRSTKHFLLRKLMLLNALS